MLFVKLTHIKVCLNGKNDFGASAEMMSRGHDAFAPPQDNRETIHGDCMNPSAAPAMRLTILCVAIGMTLSLAGCASDGSTYGNTSGAPATGVYVIQNHAASGTTAASASVLQFSVDGQWRRHTRFRDYEPERHVPRVPGHRRHGEPLHRRNSRHHGHFAR